MKGPLLLVDIGNTSTTTAVMRGEEIIELNRFLRKDGVDNNLGRAVEQYRPFAPSRVIVGSVVPDLTPKWRDELADRLGCGSWELVPGAPLEIPVSYPNPASIGADRLANAVAAVKLVGAPVVVADFGTALTFDIVTRDQGYIGGVIAPGIDMMYSYFGEKTALLPKLTPNPCAKVVGTSTEEAMHAGAYYGYRGMVREIFHEIRKNLNLPDISLVATGGFASQVLRGFDESVRILPHLTLRGLAFAWQFSISSSTDLYETDPN
ncbi:MAG: type III pantothenate kinase [Kiritimatiellia bacterium]